MINQENASPNVQVINVSSDSPSDQKVVLKKADALSSSLGQQGDMMNNFLEKKKEFLTGSQMRREKAAKNQVQEIPSGDINENNNEAPA